MCPGIAVKTSDTGQSGFLACGPRQHLPSFQAATCASVLLEVSCDRATSSQAVLWNSGFVHFRADLDIVAFTGTLL